MDRRTFAKSLAAGTLGAFASPFDLLGVMERGEPGLRTPAWLRHAEATLPAARITGIRIYQGPTVMPLQIPLLQSSMVVAIDTDIGITGIGEGGTLDTLAPTAARLIGRNPYEITSIWQDMYRAYHYPPGRERLHAMGALDLALWDLKGKVLNAPVYELLGGLTRNYLECYSTGGGGGGPTIQARAAAAMAAGFRYFRMDAASLTGGRGGGNNVYEARERVNQVLRDCEAMREGVGPDGNFAIDFHQRFNYTDAVRCCRMIEHTHPFLVEDPVATDLFDQDIPRLRQMTTVPLAAGEEWGARYDYLKLVENRDLDYIRISLPNTGGITEMVRVASICETHEVGICPHFTGPISTAAQVHTLGAFPIPVVMEFNYTNPNAANLSYLTGERFVTFENGKVYPNDRPGLGVTVDFDQLQLVETFTQGNNRPVYFRPDGTQITW
jgi:L-alanine-DL-glutamate epimerase-like enolase superfamily enzyme